MKQRPNILIVTFDCLRPDHLNALGYRGVRTPTFDRYIHEGTLFENAYCQAPNTWISHASLFTGCYPPAHGVRSPVGKINSALPTMAEIFQDEGYDTFGLPAMSLLSEAAGFSRGFREYSLEGLQSEPGVLNHRYFRSTEDTLSQTFSWIDRSSRPFFAWIHYFGTHKVQEELLDLPEQYRKSYSPYAQFYDGKIAYADEHFLAPLTQGLEKRELLGNTIVVLWSDHGEDLHALEHKVHSGHNWGLGEDVMRTLLLIRGPSLEKGKKVKRLTESVDVLPTLLELVGRDPVNTIDGNSLLQSSPKKEEAIVYMENISQGFLAIRRNNLKLILSHFDSEKSTNKIRWRLDLIRETLRKLLPTGYYRLLRHRRPLWDWWRTNEDIDVTRDYLLQKSAMRLYDLEEDPLEKQDLSSKLPQVVVDMKHLLDKLSRSSRTTSSSTLEQQEKEEIHEHLKNLGYL